jgi:hypothetical protein
MFQAGMQPRAGKSDQKPMRRRKFKRDAFLYATVLFCIFSFKLIIFDVGGGPTGIRADDFLIFIAFLVLLIRGDLYTIKRSRPFNLYLVFVLLNLVSALWNSVTGRVSPMISLYFVVRLPQYMIFYYLGYVLAQNGHRFGKVMTWYLAVLAVVVPLQMAGIIPVPGVFGNITSRAVGNTNGPYELAAVAAFLLCFVGYQFRGKIKGVTAFALILLSAARITFVAALVSVAKVMVQRTQSKSRLVAVFGLLAIIICFGLGAASLSTGPGSSIYVLNRLSDLANSRLPSELADAYRYTPTYKTSEDYGNGVFLHLEANAAASSVADDPEASGALRVFRWASLIKSTLAGIDSTLIGLGPSFGTTAVDGYYVRVFTETGLLGLAAFAAFAVALIRERQTSSWPFREYVFIMLATGCFIDIFVSYKPMLLLWLWHGMNQVQVAKRSRQVEPSRRKAANESQPNANESGAAS